MKNLDLQIGSIVDVELIQSESWINPMKFTHGILMSIEKRTYFNVYHVVTNKDTVHKSFNFDGSGHYNDKAYKITLSV